jgi:hypothetical protein
MKKLTHLSFGWRGTFDKLLPSEKRDALHHANWLLDRYPNSKGGIHEPNNSDWAKEWIKRYENLTC